MVGRPPSPRQKRTFVTAAFQLAVAGRSERSSLERLRRGGRIRRAARWGRRAEAKGHDLGSLE